MFIGRFITLSISIPFLSALFFSLFLVFPGNAQEIERLDEQGNPIVFTAQPLPKNV